MPTTKKRLNISLPTYIDKALYSISKRDKVPQATKALSLLALALELEEDISLNNIAESRDRKDTSFVSHSKAWM